MKTHFVDLAQRAASKGELSKFARRFGVRALVDEGSRRYADLGLRRASLSDERWLDKLVDEPQLLRQPLVRAGQRFTLGLDEAAWKQWVDA